MAIRNNLLGLCFSVAWLTACLPADPSHPVEAPGILSFRAASSSVAVGEGTTLRAVFMGDGRIEPGFSRVDSGEPIHTGPLAAARQYTLVVTAHGREVRRALTVSTRYNERFRDAARLDTPRDAHTATLLDNGEVLIAGGSGLPPIFPTAAHVYQPSTGRFAAVGELTLGRRGHAAAKLRDGRVLLVGGDSNLPRLLLEGEVYDPATKSFARTQGAMRQDRYGHTATLLADGKVAIAGGWTSRSDTNVPVSDRVELYDPATGQFDLVAERMQGARHGHTATLLGDGRDLLVGGLRFDSDVAEAELFDPVTGTFTAAGKLARPRFEHSATLLADGRVLIAGGERAQGGAVAESELWDPQSKSFLLGPSMVEPRALHATAVLPSGDVLFVGGAPEGWQTARASAELYDRKTRSFRSVGAMREARTYHTATLLPTGKVLVFGGLVPSGTNSPLAELFE